jgi:NDP-sugar pyrophosphorylase family protein
MQEFASETFFDLASFKHISLFSNSGPIWKVLEHLKNYLKVSELGKIEITISEGVYLVNPHLISIEVGSSVEPGAYIQGPCLIGKRCTIRHGAYIRGNVLVGDDCVIGHGTEIKNSILLNGAHAAHFAYLGDSIIGNKVNLGAGVKCANFKFDGSPVIIRSRGEVVATGLRKLGSIIGDNVQIGCNTVLNPGTLIGKRAWCYPSINVSGIIPEDAVVKSTARTVHSL